MEEMDTIVIPTACLKTDSDGFWYWIEQDVPNPFKSSAFPSKDACASNRNNWVQNKIKEYFNG